MIFILTELYYPEAISTGYYLTKIAEALAQKQDVTVITSLATSTFTPLPNYPQYEQRNQVNIYRCGGTSFAKDDLWGRIINGLTRSWVIFQKALSLCHKNEIVMVVTNPPLLPFMGLLLKWIKGIKLVVLVHDLYPEVLVVTGLWNANSIRLKLAQWCNDILYQQAHQIITLGRDMSQRIYGYLHNQNKEKVRLIPHWADLHQIWPQPKLDNPILQSLQLTDKFVILYSGNIGRTHSIENIIEVAKQLKDHSSYHFIVAGMGYKKSKLIEAIQQDHLTNITLLDPVPRSQLNDLLNACDVAIIALITGMSGISVPSRLYNHLASGKPIIAIADSSSEIAMLIQEHQLGWVVAPSDIIGLNKIIEQAQNNPQQCLDIGKKALKVAQNDYTFQQSIDAYYSSLSELKNDLD